MRYRQQKRGELTPDPVRLQPKAVSQDHEDWGLHPILDLDKIAHIPICRFLLKKDVPLVQETFDRQRRELQDAVNADPTGERFIKEMFLCELENHGFNYTGTAEDALDVLGLSFETCSRPQAGSRAGTGRTGAPGTAANHGDVMG